jgi:hypothetical protein
MWSGRRNNIFDTSTTNIVSISLNAYITTFKKEADTIEK